MTLIDAYEKYWPEYAERIGKTNNVGLLAFDTLLDLMAKRGATSNEIDDVTREYAENYA